VTGLLFVKRAVPGKELAGGDTDHGRHRTI